MIIFGLGNPGLEYRWTRHNAGFILADHLAKKHHRRFGRCETYNLARKAIKGKMMQIVKPLSFMNRSGLVVREYLENQPDEFLVVVDDINLALGRLRIRRSGSDGGHRGLRSIINALNTKDFPRLRIGVGMPRQPEHNVEEKSKDIADYVLSPLNRNEKKILLEAIDQACGGIEMLIASGFERAQNFINSVNVIKAYQDNRESE